MPSDSDDSKHSSSGLRVLTGDSRPPDGASAPRGPAPPQYGAGELIAEKYRLGKKLGEGGMGEVWLAHNETLDIDVAIKLIRHELASTDMADRLLHEARAAARLGHPAIVRVNDFGKTGRGDPFIVMELLAGEDLSAALAKRGRLSAIKAVRTLLPIAHALAVAHTKGIVHRDLKPENIYLAKSDEAPVQPKLVDFGVAKFEKPHSGRLTQSGALLGSPLYMSPEQARGDDVDHRADIWAFGVVLYEAITGRPPFEGKNYNAILYSIIANPPTPITDLHAGDADLWSIVERALQKDPDRRWYSMRDLGEALARWLEDRNVHEDITGASLQSAWLQWKKDEDALAPGASMPPPSDDASGVLPPIPQIALDSPIRERIITVRKPRAAPRPLLLIGTAAAIGSIVLGLSFFTARRAMEAEPPTGRTQPARAERTAATAEPAPAPADPAHERAVTEALLPDSSAPLAEPSAAPRGARPPSGPARQPKPSRPTTRDGIQTSDPYGGKRSKAPLKNPFN